MKRWLITFSGTDYDDPTGKTAAYNKRCLGSPEEEQTLLVYDDVWLASHPFSKVNRWLFEHPGQNMLDGSYRKRGCGWYAFKPLVILDALSRASEGDVVLYVDGDTCPIADLSPIYEIAARDGAMFFAASHHRNEKWCKRDCYIVMGQDEHRYQYSQAGVARFMAVRKGDYKATQLLCEWLTYSTNRLANTFDPSVLGPELPEFVEHRCEQSILTLLCHKHGYKLHREACQAGEGFANDRDLYPQLFVQVEGLTRYAADSNGRGSRWRNV